jgi:hypothetical protein
MTDMAEKILLNFPPVDGPGFRQDIKSSYPLIIKHLRILSSQNCAITHPSLVADTGCQFLVLAMPESLEQLLRRMQLCQPFVDVRKF